MHWQGQKSPLLYVSTYIPIATETLRLKPFTYNTELDRFSRGRVKTHDEHFKVDWAKIVSLYDYDASSQFYHVEVNVGIR